LDGRPMGKARALSVTAVFRSTCSCGDLRGVHDVLVAGAAAEVGGDRVADVVLGRLRVIAKERGQRHQDAGRAKATLQAVRLTKGALQWIARAVRGGQALDRLNLMAVRLDGQHQARAGWLAVDEDRARAAHAVLAADMGAGQREILSNEITEEQARLDG